MYLMTRHTIAVSLNTAVFLLLSLFVNPALADLARAVPQPGRVRRFLGLLVRAVQALVPLAEPDAGALCR